MPSRPLPTLRLAAAAFLLLASLPALGEDATVHVYDAAFDEMAGRIEPIEMSGRYAYRVGVGWMTVTICDSAWSARVTHLAFHVTPTGIQITGTVSARWCNASFSAPLKTTGDVVYDAAQSVIRVTVNPTSIQPRVSVLGYQVRLPVTIDVAPALTIPPLPIGIGWLVVQTPNGEERVAVMPRNLTLTKLAGYVELRGDVSVW